MFCSRNDPWSYFLPYLCTGGHVETSEFVSLDIDSRTQLITDSATTSPQSTSKGKTRCRRRFVYYHRTFSFSAYSIKDNMDIMIPRKFVIVSCDQSMSWTINEHLNQYSSRYQTLSSSSITISHFMSGSNLSLLA